MWDGLFKQLDWIGTLSAFAGGAAAGYQAWTSPETKERNHDRIVAVTHWASQGRWLDTMQAGVGGALKLMSRLYGAAGGAGRHPLAPYLTFQAWRMSAWISALLLFLSPLLFLATVYSERKTPVDRAWFYGSGGASLVVLLAFALTLPSVRAGASTGAWPGAFRNLGGAVFAGVRMAGVWVLLGAILIALVMSKVPPNAGAISLGILMAVLLLLSLSEFVLALARHGFLAPLGFTLTLGVAAVNATAAGIGVVAISAFLAQELTEKAWVMTILIPSWPLCAMNLSAVLRGPARADTAGIAMRTAWIAAILTVGFLIVGEQNLGSYAQKFTQFVALSLFANTAPYVLAWVAAIYANAAPDWFSIALTRFVLNRATQTRKLSTFLLLLAIDIVGVLTLCGLTAVILIGAFWVSGAMIATVAPLSDAPAKLADASAYFFGGTQAPAKLMALLATGDIATEGSRNSGAVTVILLALLSLTSLLPTLLNALAVIGLVGARLIALLMSPLLTGLHGQLVVPANATAGERAMRMTRSSVIVGMLATLAFCCAYGIWFAGGRLLGGGGT